MMVCPTFMCVTPFIKIQQEEEIFFISTRVLIRMVFRILKKWLKNMDWIYVPIQLWPVFLTMTTTATWICTLPLTMQIPETIQIILAELRQPGRSLSPGGYIGMIGIAPCITRYFMMSQSKLALILPAT